MIKKFLKHHPVHKIIVSKFDLLFIVRPTLFFSVWVMVSIGMYCAQTELLSHPLWISDISYETLFIFIGLTFICASVFIINQIEDIESDDINNKLFLVGKHVSINKSLLISKYLFRIGIIISIISNWVTSIFVFLIYLVWGVLYNKNPYAWKKKPLLGWLANCIVGLLLLMIGWSIVVSNQIDNQLFYFEIIMFKKLLPYLLCFASVSILTNLPDMKGDIVTGEKTFSIVYGKKITLTISFIFILIALVLSLINLDPVSSTASIVSLPFFLFSTFRSLDKDVLRTIRYPIFIINLFVISIYPWLFVPLIITFYFSKYYYWHRFNLHYPTFLVEND